MKIVVKEKDRCIEAVMLECTPTEALVLNQAMRIYAYNNVQDIHDIDRDLIRQMLEVEPIFEEEESEKE